MKQTENMSSSYQEYLKAVDWWSSVENMIIKDNWTVTKEAFKEFYRISFGKPEFVVKEALLSILKVVVENKEIED